MLIPPTKRYFRKKRLTYDGHIQSNGHPFVQDLSDLTRTAALYQNHAMFFWKAQCLFRGLNTTGTMGEMIDRLRVDGHKPMIPELIDLAREMRIDYTHRMSMAKQQEEVMMKEKAWNNLTDVEKANSETRKFLQERFSIGQSGESKGLILIKAGGGRSTIQEAASSLGLVSDYVQTSEYDKSPIKKHKYYLVIGTSRAAVKEKIRGLHNLRDISRQEVEEDMEKVHSDVLLASKNKEWDITGDWHISCPEIEEKLGGPFTLKIYNKESSGQCQMFAEFDFGRNFPRSGLFRVDQQLPSDTMRVSKPAESNYRRKIRSQIEDKHSLFSSTSELFFFPAPAKPSTNQSTSNYRWTSEAGIFLGLIFGEYPYSITLGEPKGTKITGNFGGLSHTASVGGLAHSKEDCEFTGVKVGMGGTPRLEITSIWDDKGAAAHKFKGLLHDWAAAN